MTTLRSHYLNTLGIPEYLHVPRKPIDLPKTSPIKIRCLVVEIKNTHSICQPGVEQDFLYRMLGAIGVSQKDVICIEAQPDNLSQEISKYNAKVVLLAGSDLSSVSINSFVIHHPSGILKNDQLKREAWEVLKKVKECLR